MSIQYKTDALPLSQRGGGGLTTPKAPGGDRTHDLPLTPEGQSLGRRRTQYPLCYRSNGLLGPAGKSGSATFKFTPGDAYCGACSGT
jgi:hypothetical protein